MTTSLLAAMVRLLVGVHLQHMLPPPRGVRIYFANHASNLDFVVIWAVLPPALRRRTRPVAAHDYWTRDGIRRFLANEIFHALLVERKSVTKSNNPLVKMEEVLSGGEDLMIFPEGTRSRDGCLHEFKAGLYHLAKKFPEAELMPVNLENLNRILPKGEFLPVPILGRVKFGNPIASFDPSENKQAFLDRARAAVAALGAAPCQP